MKNIIILFHGGFLKEYNKGTKMKVFISSQSFGKINSKPIATIKSAGYEVILNPLNRKLNEKELIELIDDAVGLIVGTEKITKNVLNHAKSLKVISRYGVGIDNIDLDAARKRKIRIYNTQEAPAKAVAELTLSLILNLLRRIPESNKSMKYGGWQIQMGNSLFNKTLGVLGLGRIGKELVKLVQPFEMKILSYEINPNNEFADQYNVQFESFEEVLAQSDILSLHLPLIKKKTRCIIGEYELSIMKYNSILINTARGGLVDEDALINALNEGSIKGAALDVFEKEPYNGRLLDFDNVLLTPHIGSYTEETRMIMEMKTVKNLIIGLSRV